MFHNNFRMNSVKPPQGQTIEIVPNKMVEGINIDTLASKRVAIKRINKNNYSTLSPKDTTGEKSTKYQTIMQSQGTFNDHLNKTKEGNESFINQDETFE